MWSSIVVLATRYYHGLRSLVPRANFWQAAKVMVAELLLQHNRVDWDARLPCLGTSTTNPQVEVRTSWGLVPSRTAGLRAAGGRQVLGQWLERRPKEGPDGKGRPPRPKQLAAPDSHTGSHEADRVPLGFAICRTISAGLDPLSIESFTGGSHNLDGEQLAYLCIT